MSFNLPDDFNWREFDRHYGDDQPPEEEKPQEQDVMRLVEGIEWSYEPGAVCAFCGEKLSWYGLTPYCAPNWMECEDCEMLFNVESEEVFYYGPSQADKEFEAIRKVWLSRSEHTVSSCEQDGTC